MRLRLPTVLAAAVLGTVTVVAACGDDDAPVDAATTADIVEHYFCVDNGGQPDAGPTIDANPCGQVVTNPADCPEGCEPVG